MTIITTKQSGSTMRGKSVPIRSKTICDWGKAKDGWGKSLFSVYWDETGYENGSKLWISVHILRRAFNLWVLRIDQFAPLSDDRQA